MMEAYIRSEIAKRLAELKTLDARVSVLRIELGVLENLLANAPKETPDADRSKLKWRERESPPTLEPAGANYLMAKSTVTSGRRLKEKWRIVLAEAVRRYPSSVATEEVGQIQADHEIEPASQANIRTHFWACSKAGLYERAGYAAYRATQKAADIIGAPLGNGVTKNDEPPPEGANGSVAGEGEDEQPSPPSL